MTRTQAYLTALAAVLCCAAEPLMADTGRDLAAQCQQALRLNVLGVEALDVDEVIEGVYCVGYIGGLLDGMIVAEEEIEPRSARARPTVCLPPDGVDMAQAVRVVLAWLEGHPDDLAEPARVVVHRALVDSFPCERKRSATKKRP